MAKEEIKLNIKWTRGKAKKFGMILLAILVSYLLINISLYAFKPSCSLTDIVNLFYSISVIQKPICYVNYGGAVLNFRVDLRETDKVPVKPGPTDISATIGNIWVKNITIVYLPTGDSDKDKIYSIEVFEIANKLKLAMLVTNVNDVGINAKPLSDFNTTDYTLLSGLIQHPLIVIVHPAFANQTIVYSTSGHVVYIEATSNHNLDLAVAKFLLSALKINYNS